MTDEYRKYIFSGDITKPLDFEALFGKGRRVEVDVGCGMGRFILARAAAHPDVQFIGIERLKPRVEKIAKKAWQRGITNIFIIRLEAAYVLRYLLPEHAISRFYLFFSDPWPKRRHAGHRVFNAEFRSLVWSRLISGGDLQVATDSIDYFGDMLAQMKDDERYTKVAPVERTEDEQTDFERIFLGQGMQPGYAGFESRSPEAIGSETLKRYADEDQARLEAFWNEEMPHNESVHICGIGGVGMSAVAQAYLDAGAEVTGSDRLIDKGDTTPTLDILKAQGVKLYPQDGSGIGDATTKLIVSTAIEQDNADLLAAKEHGVTVLHRSEAVNELVSGRRLIAVAGTSGKSTTTALTAWILSYAGLDPTVINGAAIVSFDNGGKRLGSVRKGNGEWAIIEADESDRSFLRYTPEYAIVTNESADHFDETETHELFAKFKSQVTASVIDTIPQDLEITSSTLLKTKFKFGGKEFSVSLPGRHNACNSAQAIMLARAVGIADETIRRALLTFPGVERRLEKVGYTANKTIVIDDYGHNPAKLSAAISTVSASAKRVAVLWRPHGYAPLRNMLSALADTFAKLRLEDRLFLLPVYDAGGTADRSVSSDMLKGEISKRGYLGTTLVSDIAAAEKALTDVVNDFGEDDAILICGARDYALPVLARSIT